MARSSSDPVLQRLLLLPLLTPLLGLLLIAAINPRPWVSLQLLTWRSPSGPLGAWIAAATAAGAGLSAAGTALALRSGSPALPARRQVRRGADRDTSSRNNANDRPEATWAGPSRSAGEPAPTVSVPFRVIRKGPASSGGTSATTPVSPGGSGDGWDQSASEDW